MPLLSPDQFRFFAANLGALSLALPHCYIPKYIRNEYSCVPGILMLYYCFGHQANSLVLFSAISYIICKFTPPQYIQRIMLCSSLSFLSYAHLTRQLLDYGGYVLDISGPFMIAVQKMTSLGFCLHDGFKFGNENDNNQDTTTDHADPGDSNSTDKHKLIKPMSATSVSSADEIVGLSASDKKHPTEEQKRYAMTKCPGFSEFMGYFFHFPSILCGPIAYYRDYIDFIDAPYDKELPKGRYKAVAKKLTISISCAMMHLTFAQTFEVEFLRSTAFLVETRFILRFLFIVVFTMYSRLKYYVAWYLGEAISNAAGLGFNGYGKDGKPKWDLISNMDLWKFETSLNLRDAIHAWNKTTQSWLRRTSYERAPKKLALISTFSLSAFWHGFYPGYYLTFVGGAFFTKAARNGRRIIKPLFQRSRLLSKVYDVITFILTRLTIAYIAFPFVLLEFWHSIEMYRSLHFSLHWLGLGGLLLGFLPRLMH